jgi:hypothetical protein
LEAVLTGVPSGEEGALASVRQIRHSEGARPCAHSDIIRHGSVGGPLPRRVSSRCLTADYSWPSGLDEFIDPKSDQIVWQFGDTDLLGT